MTCQAQFLWLMIVVFCFAGVAKAQENSVYIINADEGPITFYRIETDFSLTPIGHLPDEFSISGLNDSDRRVLGWAGHNFALAPDGEHIAFTVDTFDDQTAFLIYSLETNEIDEVFVADFFPFATLLRWSPDSQMVLIEPIACDCTGYRYPYPETYIYLIKEEKWQAITTTPTTAETEAVWRSDSEQIALSAYRDGIYLSSSDGNSRQLLDEIAPDQFYDPYTIGTACNFAWSDVSQLWYYEFGCSNINLKFDYVFSLSLEGNTTLESNLPELFGDEYSIPPDDDHFRVMIEGIYSSTDGAIYAAAHIQTFDDVTHNIFRVVEINGDPNSNIHFEFITSGNWDNIVTVAFETDQQLVAFRTARNLTIGNLITGMQVAQVPVDEKFFKNSDIQWLGETHLIYNTLNDVWLLNIKTSETVNLTADFDKRSWLLPQTDSTN